MSDTVSLRLKAAAGDARAQTELAHSLLLAGRTGEAMQNLNAACAQNFAPALLQHAALATLGLAGSANAEVAAGPRYASCLFGVPQHLDFTLHVAVLTGHSIHPPCR